MRVDLEPHPAGDLESGVATRPASSAAAAAAAAAAALQQQQQRIPPARSRRGHAAHQKKHREEAVLTRRPAQHQHQPHASLQHVDWHTSLRHICTASSRWNLRSRRAVVVAQWPQLRPRTPGRGQRARRPVAGTASERDQRHRARAKYIMCLVVGSVAMCPKPCSLSDRKQNYVHAPTTTACRQLF